MENFNTFNTIEEKAAEWNVSIRHIQHLCRSGNVSGALKRAGAWFIPIDSPIPVKNSKRGLNGYGKNFKLVGTKNNIFNSALDLFLLKGFHNVSFKDIAGDIGIRQSTIYNYFKSKQEILDTIYDFYCHYYLTERISIADMEKIIQDKSLLEIIGHMNYDFKEEHRQKMIDITILILQRIGIDDRAKEITKTLIVDEGIKYVETIFDNAVKKGRFAPFDTHIMAVLVNAIRIFKLYYWVVDQSPDKQMKLLKDERALYKYASEFLIDLKQPIANS